MQAEANVKKFLKKRRNKNLWDRISNVFQFHRDEKQLALYSQLHEWALLDSDKEVENEIKELKESKHNDLTMTILTEEA